MNFEEPRTDHDVVVARVLAAMSYQEQGLINLNLPVDTCFYVEEIVKSRTGNAGRERSRADSKGVYIRKSDWENR